MKLFKSLCITCSLALVSISFSCNTARKTAVASGNGDGAFNRGEFNFVSKNPIDFVFVTGHFLVSSHKTIDDSENQLYTSDHFPVLTRVHLK